MVWQNRRRRRLEHKEGTCSESNRGFIPHNTLFGLVAPLLKHAIVALKDGPRRIPFLMAVVGIAALALFSGCRDKEQEKKNLSFGGISSTVDGMSAMLAERQANRALAYQRERNAVDDRKWAAERADRQLQADRDFQRAMAENTLEQQRLLNEQRQQDLIHQENLASTEAQRQMAAEERAARKAEAEAERAARAKEAEEQRKASDRQAEAQERQAAYQAGTMPGPLGDVLNALPALMGALQPPAANQKSREDLLRLLGLKKDAENEAAYIDCAVDKLKKVDDDFVKQLEDQSLKEVFTAAGLDAYLNVIEKQIDELVEKIAQARDPKELSRLLKDLDNKSFAGLVALRGHFENGVSLLDEHIDRAQAVGRSNAAMTLRAKRRELEGLWKSREKRLASLAKKIEDVKKEVAQKQATLQTERTEREGLASEIRAAQKAKEDVLKLSVSVGGATSRPSTPPASEALLKTVGEFLKKYGLKDQPTEYVGTDPEKDIREITAELKRLYDKELPGEGEATDVNKTPSQIREALKKALPEDEKRTELLLRLAGAYQALVGRSIAIPEGLQLKGRSLGEYIETNRQKIESAIRSANDFRDRNASSDSSAPLDGELNRNLQEAKRIVVPLHSSLNRSDNVEAIVREARKQGIAEDVIRKVIDGYKKELQNWNQAIQGHLASESDGRSDSPEIKDLANKIKILGEDKTVQEFMVEREAAISKAAHKEDLDEIAREVSEKKGKLVLSHRRISKLNQTTGTGINYNELNKSAAAVAQAIGILTDDLDGLEEQIHLKRQQLDRGTVGSGNKITAEDGTGFFDYLDKMYDRIDELVQKKDDAGLRTLKSEARRMKMRLRTVIGRQAKDDDEKKAYQKAVAELEELEKTIEKEINDLRPTASLQMQQPTAVPQSGGYVFVPIAPTTTRPAQ